MTPCDCAQGSEENGWHETVGPKCYERELEKWWKASEWLNTEYYRDFMDRLRAGVRGQWNEEKL